MLPSRCFFAITLILKWFFAAAKAQLNNNTPTRTTLFVQFKHEAYESEYECKWNFSSRRNLFHHNNRIMFYSRRRLVDDCKAGDESRNNFQIKPAC
jgi:hypothetical protein